jgi:ABC-type transporter Mla subunit MlaD
MRERLRPVLRWLGLFVVVVVIVYAGIVLANVPVSTGGYVVSVETPAPSAT